MSSRKKETEKKTKAVDPETPVKTAGMSKKQMALLQGRLISAKFGNMIAILMQSKVHQDMRLSQLHDRIVAPLLSNQFRIAEAQSKEGGEIIPVALLMWARVSDEVHERLKNNLDAPIELARDEWSSGENYWIVDAIGQQRFLIPLLTDLRNSDLKDKQVSYRAEGKEGVELRVMEHLAEAAE